MCAIILFVSTIPLGKKKKKTFIDLGFFKAVFCCWRSYVC